MIFCFDIKREAELAFFQKLTTSDGRVVFVNCDLITSLQPLAGATSKPFTRLTFDREHTLAVQEDPHHILGGLPADRLADKPL